MSDYDPVAEAELVTMLAPRVRPGMAPSPTSGSDAQQDGCCGWTDDWNAERLEVCNAPATHVFVSTVNGLTFLVCTPHLERAQAEQPAGIGEVRPL